MAQHGEGKNDLWQGYMAVLVVNHGITKSISKLTADIYLMMKCCVDIPPLYFCQDVEWMLTICWWLQLCLQWIWTAYTSFHILCYRNNILIVCQQ
jgi:hypothetical protein